MKIVVIEPIGLNENIVNEYKKEFEIMGHELITYNNRVENDDKLITRAKNADIIILTNIPLTRNMIINCSKLKLISVAFTGIDHIDLAACKEQDIMVCNASGYANQAVAELTIGMIINLLRNVINCDKATRKEETREELIGNELFGKTMGIVGTGCIGMKVAELGAAFGCNLLGHDKVEREKAKDIGVKYTTCCFCN